MFLSWHLNLKLWLKTLDILDIFYESTADFCNIIQGIQGLFVSNALHEVFIEVNEKGREAAGVTGI